MPGRCLRLVPILCVIAAVAVLTAPLTLHAQSNRDPLNPAPKRRADEGKGPFGSMLIRGATLIDGTGAPPRGPVDILVEGNRIKSIRSSASSKGKADFELDASGQYVLPGFVDMHVHGGGAPKNADAEYAYKLWLAPRRDNGAGRATRIQRLHRQ